MGCQHSNFPMKNTNRKGTVRAKLGEYQPSNLACEISQFIDSNGSSVKMNVCRSFCLVGEDAFTENNSFGVRVRVPK